jgi:hypothetical protein
MPGTFFLMAHSLQMVLGYTPFESGLFQLPFAFIMMLVAPRVPRFVARWGAAKVVPVGLTFTAGGLAAFSGVGVDSSLLHVYASVLPLGLGMAITMTPLTTLIMSSVPLGRAGVGSAMNDTTRELGGALGVAVLGSVVTSQYTSGIGTSLAALPTTARALADSGLAGALAVAGEVGGAQGDALALAAKQAFVDGLNLAALVGAVVVFVAAFVSWKLLPRTTSAPFVSPPRDEAADPAEQRTLVD